MTRRHVGTGCAVLAALIVGVACGGGGGGAPEEPPPTLSFTGSTASLDGWARTDAQYSAAGVSPPYAGDIDGALPAVTASAYYTFDVSILPANAQIVGATMSVDVTNFSGDPYGKLGSLRAHYLPYGNNLANAIGMIVLMPPTPAPFSPANASLGTKTADVKELLERALADGYTRLQVRVAFASLSNNDGISDWVDLTDAENLAAIGNAPSLSFSWRAP